MKTKPTKTFLSTSPKMKMTTDVWVISPMLLEVNKYLESVKKGDRGDVKETEGTLVTVVS